MKKFLLVVYLFFAVCTISVFAQDTKSKAGSNNLPQQVEISVSDNKIQIQNAVVGQKVEIFSVIGIKMAEFEIKTVNGDYSLNVPKGYYIVKIGEVVRKIVFR